MEKRLEDYLHYYLFSGIAIQVEYYDDPGGYETTLTHEVYSKHIHIDECVLTPFLRPVTAISKQHASELVNMHPKDYGETFDFLIKKGYDLFGLIDVGLANSTLAQYE